MRILRENDNILMGFLIGATIPILGYFCVDTIFALMTDNGIMDEVTQSSSGQRIRTTALISLCFNIIPLQVIKSRLYGNIIKGLVFATLIYAGLWFFYFHTSLF